MCLLDEIIHDFDIKFSEDHIQCFNMNFLFSSILYLLIYDRNRLNNRN